MLMTTAITLIFAHFADPLSKDSDQSLHPEGALGHIAGSEIHWAITGAPRRQRMIRSWLTFWPDDMKANAFLTERHDRIPLLQSAEQTSVALLAPFATHGDVNWFDPSPQPLGLSLAQRPDKTDPVFVITSAGLGGFGRGAAAFGRGTRKVRRAMQNHEALMFEGQILPDDPRIDGPTLSLWPNQSAVLDFAYKSDPHKTAMKVVEHDDILRGSFTRCAVRSFDGYWNGKRVML
jgi:hypothetical protein